MSLEYLLAGPADDADYAQSEYLAELLMSSLPSVKCTFKPILPEQWSSFVEKQSGFLGCKPRAPLIWMGSGVVIGGFTEFAAECDAKYGVAIKGVEASRWSRVAQENLAAAQKKALGAPEPVVGDGASGAALGAKVCEALLLGNERYLLRDGETGSLASYAPPVPMTAPSATVLALTSLPAPAHSLLDCDEGSLFVVPCTAAGIEELAVGNVEYGVVSRHTKAILILAAVTPEFSAYVRAAKHVLSATDAPLPPEQAEVLECMMPALARTLAIAPPHCTPDEVDALCVEEWVRECAEELLRQSGVLAELAARESVLIQRASIAPDGSLKPV